MIYPQPQKSIQIHQKINQIQQNEQDPVLNTKSQAIIPPLLDYPENKNIPDLTPLLGLALQIHPQEQMGTLRSKSLRIWSSSLAKMGRKWERTESHFNAQQMQKLEHRPKQEQSRKDREKKQCFPHSPVVEIMVVLVVERCEYQTKKKGTETRLGKIDWPTTLAFSFHSKFIVVSDTMSPAALPPLVHVSRNQQWIERYDIVWIINSSKTVDCGLFLGPLK